MTRNIIKLAGGPYERLKLLSGDDALRDREVVISKDTNELFVGLGDGNFHLLSNTLVGENKNVMQTLDPQEGRYFYDSSTSFLYFGTGTGWKRVRHAYEVGVSSALEVADDGSLSVKVDDKSIKVNASNALEIGSSIDLGVFEVETPQIN